MKLLVDSSVPDSIIDQLRLAGHDAVAVADTPPDPGDEAILQRAILEHRTIITLDKDFGTHAILGAHRHFGIVRLVQIGLKAIAPSLVLILNTHETELVGGALITVEPGRTRIRTL
jgi:predicted nuclease of predicted toxin-antitoxin system